MPQIYLQNFRDRTLGWRGHDDEDDPSPARTPSGNRREHGAGTRHPAPHGHFFGRLLLVHGTPFDEVAGVISTTSGYIGGHVEDPTYREVSAGGTGHTEAVEVLYDPSVVSYAELLEIFWQNIDPVTSNRQFCDSESQYLGGVFYHDEEQERLARESKPRSNDRNVSASRS